MHTTALPSRGIMQLLLSCAVCVACDSSSEPPPPPLTVVSITPAANATRVAVADTVRIVFSSAVDASTVTAASVNITGAAVVPGTATVAGSTVTLVPTNLLTEFRTQYTVNVTSAVRSTAGGSLNAPFTSTFTTMFLDTAYYYRILNAQTGAARAVGTFAGGLNCFFPDTANTTGQRWYFVEIPNTSFHLLRNHFTGDSFALEGGTPGQPCLMTARPPGGGNFTGQAWGITASGSGYRLTNQNLGAAMSLDVLMIDDAPRPGMAATSAATSQVWSFARLFRRSLGPPPPPNVP